MQSETIGKVAAALAKAQAEIGIVAKNKTLDTSKGGRADGWASTYADLPTLWKAAREVLPRHGLALTQVGHYEKESNWTLRTVVVHAESGEFIGGEFPIKTSRDGAQGFGGGVSFARRWGLACVLMLVSEDDAEDREEGPGYKPPKPGKAAPDLGRLVGAITGAADGVALEAAAQRARTAFPMGEPKNAVDTAIGDWLVAALGAAESDDAINECRALATKIRPSGLAVSRIKAAIEEAQRRVRVPT